jgi:hypothetical protein
MSARHTPPVQEDVEKELRDKFQTGDITSVAAWLGCDRTSLSRQLNPEEPQPSVVFEVLRFLDSCQRVRPELFEDVAGVILDFINSRRSQATPQGIEFSQVHKSLSEVIEGYIEKAPYKDRLKTTRRAIALLQQHENDLMLAGIEDSADAAQGGKVTSFARA